MSFLGYFYIGFLGTCLIFLGTFYRSMLYHICITHCRNCVFTFPLSHLTALCALEPAPARHSKSKLFLCSRLLAAFTLKTIRQAHCNIPAGGADAAAVGAVAFVGDVLKRCIEREAARELQRCAQV